MPKQTFFNLPDGKRERIIDLAIDEFAENDYQNASISRLVERACIAKGSFYQYFEDKEDLYCYLLGLVAREKQSSRDSKAPDPGNGLFAYVHWLARERVRFELSNPRLSQVVYRAVTGHDCLPSFVERYNERELAYFRTLVGQGKVRGDIAPEVDEDLAAFVFNTLFTELGRYVMQRFSERPGEGGGSTEALQAFFAEDEVQAILDQTLRILQSGMAPRETTFIA